MKKNFLQVLQYTKLCFHKTILVFLFIAGLSASSNAQNLLYNGDFEYGASGNGFVTNDPSYFYLATPNGVSFAGNWAISNNPQLVNSGYVSGTDHSGTGNMMIVDGTTNGGGKRFWKAGNNGNGIIGFITGTSYTFSYWIKSVSNDPSRANIGVFFNNVSNVVLASGNATAPIVADGWQQVKYTFTANGNTVNIELYDNNTDAIGNDFAIDDIELYGPPQPFSFSYSSVNPTCSNVSDGSIVAYGTGGTQPYLYSFDGGAFTSNNVLNGLTTSNHTITVQDAALNTLTSPVIHIISPTDVLDATTHKDSICSGHSATLNATGGGNNGYTWVATPADPTLSVNATSPVVSPLVPTIYVVSTSSTYVTNLVFNGDFELGNNGFSTDYVFKTSNTSGAQRTYGITDSASKFYSAFSNCGDHTTGSGKMFVCDGSTNPTNRMWNQTVPVKPGSTYTFTYWIQSITSPSPAQIETRINGVVLPAGTSANPYTAPATDICNNWQKVSYSWTAGVGVTSADLSIYDKNFVDIGNDFAIDDVSFITLTTTCTLVDSVKVFVTTTTSSITDFSYTPNAICVGSTTNPTLNTVPSFTTGGTYTATPAGLKIDSLTGAIDVANSLPNSYNVTYFAPIVGCRLSGSSSTIITIRPLVTTPTASVTVQPTCTTPTGTIVVSNPLATNYYFSADSGLNYQSSATFAGLAPSSIHYILVKDTNAGGCFSDTISLTINPVTPPPPTPTGSVSFQPTCAVSTGTIIVSSPHGSNYVYAVDGTTYQTDTTFAGLTANTIYPVTVKDVNTGCISSVLNLTVNPFIPVIATTNTQTFNSCKDIVYNAITYSASTILKDTVKSFQGCDSLYNVVNININPITTTTNTQTFSSCKDIIYNSITYTSSTVLKDTVKSFQGCDSIYNIVNINIDPITTTTNTQTFSSCKDIVYNSITYSSTTILKDTVKSFQGCDSIYNVVNININPITTTTNTQTFSSCKDVVYNSITYSASTVLKDTVKSFQGCDSIYNIVNININPINTTTYTQTFSSCKDIVYNSITYSSTTILKDTVKSFQGCDSIYNVVNININPITTKTNTQTFSSCKDIVYNTINYSSSAVLKDTVKSFQGCDSIYNIVNININPITTTTNTQTFSSCKSIVYNSITYSASTVLKDTVKSFQGCDSIYNVVNININPINTTTNTQTFSSCKSIVYNSITYSASTVLKDTVKSFQGCDSIYNIVNININPITTTTNTQTFSSCKDIVYNGSTYSSSTLLKDTVKSFQGCDSIYNVVNININHITTTTNNINILGCDSVIYKGITYKSNFVLNDTIKSVQGCDSVYNIVDISTFTIQKPTAIIIQPTCINPTGTIIITSPKNSAPLSFLYSIGGAFQSDTTFNGLASGLYLITAKEATVLGCISTPLSLTVNPIPAAPTAVISYVGNPFYNTGTANVTLTSTGTITSGTYTATPAGLSINPSTGTIDLANSAVGNYVVTYAFNSGVCSNTATTNVTINQLKTDIYIPNSFTPNGDGKNDILYVYGNTIKSVNISVYNQWGERIFNSNSQSKGWDGLGFGKMQPVGVYIYVAQIVLLDGTVLNRKGTVNLIR